MSSDWLYRSSPARHHAHVWISCDDFETKPKQQKKRRRWWWISVSLSLLLSLVVQLDSDWQRSRSVVNAWDNCVWETRVPIRGFESSWMQCVPCVVLNCRERIEQDWCHCWSTTIHWMTKLDNESKLVSMTRERSAILTTGWRCFRAQTDAGRKISAVRSFIHRWFVVGRRHQLRGCATHWWVLTEQMMVMVMSLIAIEVEVKIRSHSRFRWCARWIGLVIQFGARRLLRIVGHVGMRMIVQCWIVFCWGHGCRMRSSRKPTIRLTCISVWCMMRVRRSIGAHGIRRLKTVIVHRWVMWKMRGERM